MSIIDKARSLRATIEKISANLNDEEAAESIELFPSWKSNSEYTINDRFRYNGVLYKATQAHTSSEIYPPDVAVSLYAKVLATENEIAVWEQPDSTNGYSKGDRVYFPDRNGKIYESKIYNNVWSPIGYADGWLEID